jgi:hypothetical protein
VEFRDADMRRAWEEADAAERDPEQNPERRMPSPLDQVG